MTPKQSYYKTDVWIISKLGPSRGNFRNRSFRRGWNDPLAGPKFMVHLAFGDEGNKKSLFRNASDLQVPFLLIQINPKTVI